MSEWIYFFEEPVRHRGLIELGSTRRTVEERNRDKRSVDPWREIARYPVANCQRAEQEIIRATASHRYRSRKEILNIDWATLKTIVEPILQRYSNYEYLARQELSWTNFERSNMAKYDAEWRRLESHYLGLKEQRRQRLARDLERVGYKRTDYRMADGMDAVSEKTVGKVMGWFTDKDHPEWMDVIKLPLIMPSFLLGGVTHLALTGVGKLLGNRKSETNADKAAPIFRQYETDIAHLNEQQKQDYEQFKNSMKIEYESTIKRLTKIKRHTAELKSICEAQS